ncbi:SDR family oxidoreductase [Ferrimonas pelagia]
MQGKVVILTGASEGIGRALAQQLSGQGAKLVIAARDQARLTSLAEALPGEALVCPCDVAKASQCQSVIDAALAHFGRIDVLICNAGMTMWSRFDALQQSDVLQRLMQVNYLGAVFMTQAALPALKQSRGHLVAVASVAGLTGVPERSGYAASKHAVVGFFESLRIELLGSGVDVTQLCPDFVLTETHRRAIGADGQPLGDSPMQEGKIMTAQKCAVLMHRAIERRQRLWLGSWRARLGRWVKLLAPGWIDRITARAITQRH